MNLKQRVEKIELEVDPKQTQNALLIFQQPNETYDEVYQREILDKGIDTDNTFIICIHFVRAKPEEMPE